MLVAMLILLYFVVTLICIAINNTVLISGSLIITIGLFIQFPMTILKKFDIFILYSVIGMFFDSIFEFLPFGFTMFFLLIFYAIQNIVVCDCNRPLPSERVKFEQLSNFMYVCALFMFNASRFRIFQFITTLILSQITVLTLSSPMEKIQRKLSVVCGKYFKYK